MYNRLIVPLIPMNPNQITTARMTFLRLMGGLSGPFTAAMPPCSGGSYGFAGCSPVVMRQRPRSPTRHRQRRTRRRQWVERSNFDHRAAIKVQAVAANRCGEGDGE